MKAVAVTRVWRHWGDETILEPKRHFDTLAATAVLNGQCPINLTTKCEFRFLSELDSKGSYHAQAEMTRVLLWVGIPCEFSFP